MSNLPTQKYKKKLLSFLLVARDAKKDINRKDNNIAILIISNKIHQQDKAHICKFKRLLLLGLSICL